MKTEKIYTTLPRDVVKALSIFILAFLLQFQTPAQAATTFTEFYCQTTGSNLNAGSTTADAALVTSANGNWDATTGIFICNGATDLSGVSAGMWASVYNDGASVAVFVARIVTVVDATDTITLSTTAIGGTAPTTSATARTIKIGGAWKGPNAAEGFPFGFVTSTMTNLNSGVVQGFVPRVNIKGGTTYNITAAMTHANAGPIRFQGYTTTPGDQGKATIDGGTSGTSYIMLSVTGVNIDLADLIFANNGATGSAVGFQNTSGTEMVLTRVVIHNVRGTGFNLTGIGFASECEAYLCNQNAATGAGFNLTASWTMVRCISHDNAGANTDGFASTVFATFIKCIADSNGRNGMLLSAVTQYYIYGCDLYNNAGSGVDFTGSSAAMCAIQNCNFVKNTLWGINSSGSPVRNGNIVNCGFGAGTQVNGSGAIAAVGGMNETGTVTYANDVTPWTDPANGDFRITLAASKGAGRGSFTETQASYAGTIAYPDIGAAQHLDAATIEKSYPFVQ